MNPVTNIDGLSYDRVWLKTSIKILDRPLNDLSTKEFPEISIRSNSSCVIIRAKGKDIYVPFENVILLEKII